MRFQFSLATLLVCMTVSAVVCAVAVGVPVRLIFEVACLATGVFYLLAAFFPNWQLRWNFRRNWPPMSVVGRLAVGISCLSVFLLARSGGSSIGRTIVILLIVATLAVQVRDELMPQRQETQD
jgi:hypothetical protein